MPSNKSLMDLPTAQDVQVLVSDLYLAAYLLSQGSALHSVSFDEAARATLIVKGPDALHHRKAFASGNVCVSLPAFRETLNALRDLIQHLKQRHHNPRNQTFHAPSFRSHSSH